MNDGLPDEGSQIWGGDGTCCHKLWMGSKEFHNSCLSIRSSISFFRDSKVVTKKGNAAQNVSIFVRVLPWIITLAMVVSFLSLGEGSEIYDGEFNNKFRGGRGSVERDVKRTMMDCHMLGLKVERFKKVRRVFQLSKSSKVS